ncbi:MULTISPECIES: hypothetical protein [Halobacterium]|uniref:hypothetical protein n=1 Tax=Halobacterium TaxID=2239 RepID=UPI00073E6D87|nr:MULTISPECIES: hypothetical protein [Halobacterium]MCG1002169.1 hypothetical protein [Halobacterium noricense]
MTPSITAAVRGLTVVVVAAFLGVLGWYLGQSGYTSARLALFAALGASAIAGAAGVVSGRAFVAAGGACALLLLGFWQAALWLYVFPVAGLLVVAAVVLAADGGANAAA